MISGRSSISTHAPAGGATRRDFQGRTARRAFLLTPLREGRRTALRSLCSTRITISTHAPAGGATRSQKSAPSDAIFLLTPLREGRLESAITGVAKTTISTHAPAGGATYTGLNDFRQKLHFYSRPCGRGDPTRFSRPNSSSSISTHAPAGGATYGFEVTLFDEDYYFYSRPCGRGDINGPTSNGFGKISTHAPAGGATADIFSQTYTIDISTHAPAGGATRSEICNNTGLYAISTHAPAGGATFRRRSAGRSRDHFYSRPCGRGDHSGLSCHDPT